MRTREKISILKKMLTSYNKDLIANKNEYIYTSGMCVRYCELVDNSKDLFEVIPELLKYKPKKSEYAYWWTRIGKIGVTKRIGAIEKTIKLLENVKKRKTKST